MENGFLRGDYRRPRRWHDPSASPKMPVFDLEKLVEGYKCAFGIVPVAIEFPNACEIIGFCAYPRIALVFKRDIPKPLLRCA